MTEGARQRLIVKCNMRAAYLLLPTTPAPLRTGRGDAGKAPPQHPCFQDLCTPVIPDAMNVCRGLRCWRCTATASCWAATSRNAGGGNAQRSSTPPHWTLRMAWLLGVTTARGNCSRQHLQVGSLAHIQFTSIRYIIQNRVQAWCSLLHEKQCSLGHLLNMCVDRWSSVQVTITEL